MTALLCRDLGLEWGEGPLQMASDEALILGLQAGTSPPTLRCYAWTRPAVSLGCAQPASDLDPLACQTRGVTIVRRASGGTAVLHQAALGFSLVLPAGLPPAVPDLIEAYRLLGQGLQAGLARLGLNADLIPPERARTNGHLPPLAQRACFAGTVPYELALQERKLVGLAQVRRRGVALLHGILYLAPVAANLAWLLQADPADRAALAAYLAAHIGDLQTATGRTFAPETVAEALAAGLADTLGLILTPGAYTSEEEATRQRLLSEKYTQPAWTARR